MQNVCTTARIQCSYTPHTPALCTQISIPPLVTEQACTDLSSWCLRISACHQTAANNFSKARCSLWCQVSVLTMVESDMILVKHSCVRPQHSSSVRDNVVKNCFTCSYISQSNICDRKQEQLGYYTIKMWSLKYKKMELICSQHFHIKPFDTWGHKAQNQHDIDHSNLLGLRPAALTYTVCISNQYVGSVRS